MAAPTAPAYYSASQTEVIWGVESVAAGTTATVTTLEPCQAISWTPARTYYDAMGYLGTGYTVYGKDLTQQHAEITLTLEYGSSRLAAYGAGAILGNSSDTVGTIAGSLYPHVLKPSMTAIRCNTFTIWYNTGDTANILRFNYATLSGITYSIDPNGILLANLTFVAKMPAGLPLALPTITNRIGDTTAVPVLPNTRTLGSQATYTINNSAGSNYDISTPPAQVYSAQIGLARDLEVMPGTTGLDPSDICTGELHLAVTGLSAKYSGIGAGTVFKDYLAYAELGDATHKHTIAFTDADGAAITFVFWPAKWADGTMPNYNGVTARIDGGLDLYHNPSALIASSGAKATVPESITITSRTQTPFVT